MNIDSLVWVDYAVIGIIGLSALIGLIRGLVREALSLIAWGLAVWVALTFSGTLAPLFAERIAAESVRVIVAFTVLFLGTLIIAAIINYLISQLVDKTGLSGTDHLLGTVFGVARGAVLMAVLLMLANATSLARDAAWQQSQLIGNFQGLALWVHDRLPPDIAQKLNHESGTPAVTPASGSGFSFPLHEEDGRQPDADQPPVIPAGP